ncbi:PLDc N-terminal domain-containing protein [Nocardioides pacificus]
MSFLDIVWFILISFAFVAYLIVMFAIIGDLFADPEASGLAKAAWFIALILLPFLTSIAYLLVRGNKMGERKLREAELRRQQQETYIKQVAGSAGPAGEIVQAKAMLDLGAITPTEFERLKEKALA